MKETKLEYPKGCSWCVYWDEANETCSQKRNPLTCEFVDDEDIEEFLEILEKEDKKKGKKRKGKNGNNKTNSKKKNGKKTPVEVECNREEVRVIADSYMQAQKLRVAIGNRIFAVRSGSDDEGYGMELLRKWHERLSEIEKECVKYAKVYLKAHPTWGWLKTIKGIGPTLAMKMLSCIDIEKADTISALWRYCGLAVIDGKAERPVKGEKLHYNKKLKTTMYLVGMSMLKARGAFTKIYYNEKERQKQLHPELSDMHIHYRALRKMLKVFLGCLWLVWREEVGLPTRPPYAIEYLGHSTLYQPWEFSEKK